MDLIDAMMERLRHIEPRMTRERLSVLEDALRHEFGGTSGRLRKKRRTKQQQAAEVLRDGFDGSIEQLAAHLGCHRTTIYRVIRSRPRNVAK